MQIGLLWFDNSADRGLAAKIEDAARRYQEKFGVSPNTCYVNSAALGGGEMTLPARPAQGLPVRVLPAVDVLPHHFFLGVEERE
jgi:hypothetical protein